MPMYRFSSIGTDRADGLAGEFGFFNDDGALQHARRLQRSKVIEVWQQDRLVGRLEPELSSAASE
jgi:hypothetical protein